MGNTLQHMNFMEPRMPRKLEGWHYTKMQGDNAASRSSWAPNRQVYGRALQTQIEPGNPRGTHGTWRYGDSSMNNYWIGTCWYFVWAACVNHRHPHDIECQKARSWADGRLPGPEALYADNIYSKGLFDPVLGEWGFYGKLSVPERRSFTLLFNKRKEQIAEYIESEGSKPAAQERMMREDRDKKRRGQIRTDMRARATQLAEYFSNFTDDGKGSKGARYLKLAKAWDAIRVQEVQALVMAGVAEEQAYAMCGPAIPPESVWNAGGKQLTSWFSQKAREAWLKVSAATVNETATRVRNVSKNDAALFLLDQERPAEFQFQMAKKVADGDLTGEDAKKYEAAHRENVTKANSAAVKVAMQNLFGSDYSPKPSDWLTGKSENPLLILAEMSRTGSPDIVERDTRASVQSLFQQEYNALLQGPALGDDATSTGRIGAWNASKEYHDRIVAAPALYFTKEGDFVDGKQPWEAPTRRWIEHSLEKYDPEKENWMRKRGKQLWRQMYGDNFPATLEAVKEVAYNKEKRNDFYKKWGGMRKLLEHEMSWKEGYFGQPFKMLTLPTPGVEIELPGGWEFETRFGSACMESHPYCPGAYWTYNDVDWLEEFALHPGIPWNTPPNYYLQDEWREGDE
eukprot:TRINITY_DN103648_c0_g1_i1.p1 TRINITY_DN103648_c0_g1~~TRINITY_DN103648_c0_g1_i1.p1  ORF type:complete len:627 (-),score=102.11 TRINITY_DN103648_c0_g1_i1:178-2058(-)